MDTAAPPPFSPVWWREMPPFSPCARTSGGIASTGGGGGGCFYWRGRWWAARAMAVVSCCIFLMEPLLICAGTSAAAATTTMIFATTGDYTRHEWWNRGTDELQPQADELPPAYVDATTVAGQAAIRKGVVTTSTGRRDGGAHEMLQQLREELPLCPVFW